MMNFIQGESWTHDLRLVQNGTPVIVGPADRTDELVTCIEVVLTVNQRVQAKYRYPCGDDFPEHEYLDIDPFDNNALRLKIARNQSKRFEPGYLTANTTVQYKDGRTLQLVQIMGNLLRGDLAARL